LATRHHGETEARAEGLEGRIEDVFEWAAAHSREVVIGIVSFLVIGGGIAAGWEWNRRAAEDAQLQLAETELAYSQAMGAGPRSIFPAEPANPDQGVRAREAALAGFEAVAREHEGSLAAELAGIRAAEIEIELGRAEAAEQRLQLLADAARHEAMPRGAALRLRGYALEELGRWSDAGDAYGDAGGVARYPDRAAAWLSAADNYARAGDSARELGAYQQILELDLEFADRYQVTERLNALGSAPSEGTEPTAPPAG